MDKTKIYFILFQILRATFSKNESKIGKKNLSTKYFFVNYFFIIHQLIKNHQLVKSCSRYFICYKKHVFIRLKLIVLYAHSQLKNEQGKILNNFYF